MYLGEGPILGSGLTVGDSRHVLQGWTGDKLGKK